MKTSVCAAVVLLAAGAMGACPGTHPYEACGRCWTSQSQAGSEGCNGGAPPPTGPNPVPEPAPSPPSTGSCSGDHPYEACGRCWSSQSQARAGGCNGAAPPPSPASPPPQTPPPPAPQPGPGPGPGPAPPAGRAKFEPKSGRLLFVGQDTDSVDRYVAAFGRTPYGVTGYTSVERLEGLTTPTDYGTGTQHLQYLATTYPEAALAVGVYLVDQLERINNGQLAGELEALIDTLAGFDRKIFFRFGYEVDGAWNHYDPAAFKAAWRTAHRMVQDKGYGDKFAFVWQVASYCAGTFNGHPISAWWPGDEYVDWVGQSTFTQYDCNWGPNNEAVLFARQHKKPMMVAEAANQGYQNDELTYASPLSKGQGKQAVTAEAIWDQWFAPWFRWVEETKTVKAVAYITADWDSQSNWNGDKDYANGYWGDTRLEVNPLIKQRWADKVGKASWKHA